MDIISNVASILFKKLGNHCEIFIFNPIVCCHICTSILNFNFFLTIMLRFKGNA